MMCGHNCTLEAIALRLLTAGNSTEPSECQTCNRRPPEAERERKKESKKETKKESKKVTMIQRHPGSKKERPNLTDRETERERKKKRDAPETQRG